MELAQLNVEIPGDVMRRAKKGAIDANTSLREYVRVAIDHFNRSLTVDARRAMFSRVSQRKTVGRPVEVKAA